WEVPVSVRGDLAAAGCHGRIVLRDAAGNVVAEDDLVFAGVDQPQQTITLQPSDRRYSILIAFRANSEIPHPWLEGKRVAAGIHLMGARFAIHQKYDEPLSDSPYLIWIMVCSAKDGVWYFDDVIPLAITPSEIVQPTTDSAMGNAIPVVARTPTH